MGQVVEPKTYGMLTSLGPHYYTTKYRNTPNLGSEKLNYKVAFLTVSSEKAEISLSFAQCNFCLTVASSVSTQLRSKLKQIEMALTVTKGLFTIAV